MDMTLQDSAEWTDGAAWPPTRFSRRDERLGLYRQLWGGNLAYLSPAAPPRIVTNLFRALPDSHSALLTLAPPDVDRSDLGHVIRCAVAMVTNMLRSGMAWPWFDGERLECLDPAQTYPRSDGGMVVGVRFTSSTARSAHPDKIRLTVIEPEGEWRQTVHEYSGSGRSEDTSASGPSIGTLGHRSGHVPRIGAEVREVAAGQGNAVPWVALPPANGQWGTSRFDDLAPLVLALAQMHGKRVVILDKHAKPILTFRVHNADIDDAVANYSGPADGAEDPSTWIGGKPALDTLPTSRQERVQAIIEALQARDAFELSDELSDVRYVEPHLQAVGAVTEAIDQLHEEIRLVTHLPSLKMMDNAVSGESLKRQHLLLYAFSSLLQTLLHLGLEDAWGRRFAWAHPFDAIDDSRGALDTSADGGMMRRTDPDAGGDDGPQDDRD